MDPNPDPGIREAQKHMDPPDPYPDADPEHKTTKLILAHISRTQTLVHY
jgi:hypothetical protein